MLFAVDMLYPFSITLDLYIQADSYEEAKKIAESYSQDVLLNNEDYPEIVQDDMEVVNYAVNDVDCQ